MDMFCSASEGLRGEPEDIYLDAKDKISGVTGSLEGLIYPLEDHDVIEPATLRVLKGVLISALSDLEWLWEEWPSGKHD